MVSIVFDGDQAQCIYTDGLQDILRAVGTVTTTRASHVEPFEVLPEELQQELVANLAHSRARYGKAALHGTWFADLRPSGGQVEGPFSSRGDALTFEVAWLDKFILRSDS